MYCNLVGPHMLYDKTEIKCKWPNYVSGTVCMYECMKKFIRSASPTAKRQQYTVERPKYNQYEMYMNKDSVFSMIIQNIWHFPSVCYRGSDSKFKKTQASEIREAFSAMIRDFLRALEKITDTRHPI